MVKTHKTSSRPEEALLAGRKGTLARATYSPVAINWAKLLPEARQTLKIQTDSVGYSLIYDLLQKNKYFTAGNIHNHFSQWKSIISDPFVTDIGKSNCVLLMNQDKKFAIISQ